MYKSKLKAEMLELLQKHEKPREELPEAVADFFTDERFDEMADGLVGMISKYAKRKEQEMDLTVLDDVAHLFVEQYENLNGLYTESYGKDEVALIRKTAEKGEGALYTVVATIFSDKLNQVLKDAAHGAMDYIAYVDETWTPKDEKDRSNTLAMERVHLNSLEVLLRMAQMNECSVLQDIREIMDEAQTHFHILEEVKHGIE